MKSLVVKPSAIPVSEDPEFSNAYADIEAALADIDTDDTKALYARCEQILDAIHSGRF